MKHPAAAIPILLGAAIALLAVAPGARGAEAVLVEAGSAMSYSTNLADPGGGLAWTAAGFDASAWPGGTYGVGYEAASGAQNLIRTAVTVNASSVYTRAVFTIADVTAVENLLLGADYDDGFAAWINGVEVFRSPEMPAGDPAWDTRPALHESSNGTVPSYAPLHDISGTGIPALRGGQNVLTIGVWNGQIPSSDLVLVPRLSMNQPPALTRGPYLQQGTPTGVIVRWRTDVPTPSRVAYGLAPDALASIVLDPSPVTEHLVALSGLSPDTPYFYAIGTPSITLAGGDTDHVFRTAPPPGARKPMRIWVIGDSGTANANARAVRDAYAAFAGPRDTDLWLMLGDNAYNDGTDAQYQAAVFDMYPALLARSVLWPTFGNHDSISADSLTQSGPYYDIFTLPAAGEAGGLPSGTEAYYAFDYGNIHFVCLDSQESDRSPGSAMLVWLQSDLAATDREWIIAFWHHPPYSKGSHDSDFDPQLAQMRENVLPILEDAGVDLVLTGHSHAYERSFLLDGHYGPSWTLVPAMKKDGGDGRIGGNGAYRKPPGGSASNAGAVYVVDGSSGQVGGGALNHPAMFVSLNLLGSLVLDVDGSRLDATFIDAAGIQRDTFTISKNAPPQALVHAGTAIECESPSGAVVSLDGGGSTDPDSHPGTSDDIVRYEWLLEPGGAGETPLGEGPAIAPLLALGEHRIGLRVTDRMGDTGMDTVTMRVVDTTPPEITLALSRRVVWPPNHRVVPILATVETRDLCGPPVVTLQSVTSNEPDDAPGLGDGATVNDIQGADTGTADFAFSLRAERARLGFGRIYRATYAATDASGNVSVAERHVLVPHGARRR